ncbi:hypothetical protein M8J77_020631 [Diaphorina citri]|nr:hypothetical protein M8J77_020631 [Diaphorina citri]
MTPIVPSLSLLLFHVTLSTAADYYFDFDDLTGLEDADSAGIDLQRYYNSTELDAFILKTVKSYPHLVRAETIGKSVQGRNLWAVEITHDVDSPDGRTLMKPMFKYVANMHGDETVGYALMVFLIQYLVLKDGKDDRITQLLNSTDIYIVPSINPDGFAAAKEGKCDSLDGYVGRKNAHGVDLNRNFPDQFEYEAKKAYEPETQAIMNFIYSNPFVLSGNLHGGAVVASYPFDSSPYEQNCCTLSLSPDTAYFEQVARDYASRNPMMAPGHACGFDFKDGITNGNYWYKVTGGMQDFNYVHSNCFEITMELSCCKYPKASDLKHYWAANKESLIKLIENVHRGVYGIVTDTYGNPLPSAIITVRWNDKVVTVTNRGEYWRLLARGKYVVTASAPGYEPVTTEPLDVPDTESVRLDFMLGKKNAFVTP